MSTYLDYQAQSDSNATWRRRRRILLLLGVCTAAALSWSGIHRFANHLVIAYWLHRCGNYVEFAPTTTASPLPSALLHLQQALPNATIIGVSPATRVIYLHKTITRQGRPYLIVICADSLRESLGS